jgi:nicotinamidase/pyrazinamidase
MKLNAAETLLLIIDVQNDFCPAYTSELGSYGEGALAVKDGGDVIPPLNALARSLAEGGGRVAATQDWHPLGHVSFTSSHNGTEAGQGIWPDHCVQGTRGAAFHDNLDLNPVSLIVRKGFRINLDSYSAFFENDRETSTGLEGWIRSLGITTVILGGLATDYCVFFSAIDCKKLGFNTIIASDAVRGVDFPAGSVEKAINEMRSAGIGFVPSAELLEGLR